MRYIGNKTNVLGEIDALLDRKGLNKTGLTFFDAFTGTASVAQHYKSRYRIIANDNLYFSSVIAKAKLNAECAFERLGFDPFEFFNGADTSGYCGFVTQNFAPTLSGRMYFSDENARLIDYIRDTADEWYADGRITENEKYYLVASLIESVSTVANVAGVYGAFLKKWDPRAVKRMKLAPVDAGGAALCRADVYCDDILSVIKKAEGDILYLDPPYTKNQYSVQYHLLETIALNDRPELKGKTGARDMRGKSSAFGRPAEAEVAFERLIAEAKFKHIILSYSTDGIMSKDYIESVLKRYGKKDTYEFYKFDYRRYKNSRAADTEHSEYLFYIEKAERADYASPLNFIGGKYDLVPFFRANMPKDIATFYDLFAGGFNVGINVDAEKTVYNDVNFKVRELLEYITTTDTVEFIKYVNRTVQRLGLDKENKEAYLKLREKYNKTKLAARDCRDLFLLIMYGFQQQIRFNSKLDYNNPVGQAGFNARVLEKLVSYARVTKAQNVFYRSEDYERFEAEITPADFVYIDPPYLITLGSYNDGKRGFNGWNEREERRLLAFLERLNARGIRFMLSNILEHKGKRNVILQEWIEKNGFNVIFYGERSRGNRAEAIITNYPRE